MKKSKNCKSPQSFLKPAKNFAAFTAAFLASIFPLGAQTGISPDFKVKEVPFYDVKINSGMWLDRLNSNRENTIPLAIRKCEECGRLENFKKAANPAPENKITLPWDDTDLYKTIEGASYSLQNAPDKNLEEYLDKVIEIIAKAQEPDGYLYTARTMNPENPLNPRVGKKRWQNVEIASHELYNLGHLIEGAVAHYKATGKRSLLDIAVKFADCAHREIGDANRQVAKVPGHQIAEMALVKLYLATSDKKYLELAKYFVDKRGKTERRDPYNQTHKPVLEQNEAVGHAVRANYMYAGIADVMCASKDASYLAPLNKIWENVTCKKIYITGGTGALRKGEAYGDDYYLPNREAYCETCAAVANVYWNYRMFRASGESKYFDLLERTLYNALISGVSLDGKTFFYPNPLEAEGNYGRQEWFECSCCPSNICRFMPTIGGYIYAIEGDSLYVNLFIPSSAETKINSKKIKIEQRTDYPWSGDVKVKIDPQSSEKFALKIRIPSWLSKNPLPGNLYGYADKKELSYKVFLNKAEIKSEIKDGYFSIDKTWNKGDEIEIKFEMRPRLVKANEKVEADAGKLAVEMGPVVYCAESPDNPVNFKRILLNENCAFDVKFEPELLGGINTISCDAQSFSRTEKGGLKFKDIKLKFIPYYAWAHRGKGLMKVWIDADKSRIKTDVKTTIASESKIDMSPGSGNIGAVNDGEAPVEMLRDPSKFYHWFPKRNTTEWISYEFEEPQSVSQCSVYFLDDSSIKGGCRAPENWRILYRDAEGKWREVEAKTPYETLPNAENKIRFSPINTNALKLEVKISRAGSCGIWEWQVK